MKKDNKKIHVNEKKEKGCKKEGQKETLEVRKKTTTKKIIKDMNKERKRTNEKSWKEEKGLK